MPSFLIPGVFDLSSGGVNILSGNFFSGQAYLYGLTDIQLKADLRNSGYLYVGFSGGITFTSGTINSSGLPTMAGRMDGMQLGPGDAYSVPKKAFPYQASGQPGASGNPQLYVIADANCSGNARIYLEIF